MAWNGSQMTTRSSRRHNRNRLGRFLNWAIGIVIVAIVLVGGYLLYAIMSSPATNHASNNVASSKTTSSHHSGTSNPSSGSTNTSSNGGGTSPTSPSTSTSPSSTGSSSASVGQTDVSSGTYHFVGGGINGPWQPIGTVQSEPHTTNYTLGSVDWNERVKALLYATNINDNDYILWRLENGGAPNKSLGIISTKETTNKRYDVMLQWVTGQGWKPISVKLESPSSNQGTDSSDSSRSTGQGTDLSNSSNSSTTSSAASISTSN